MKDAPLSFQHITTGVGRIETTWIRQCDGNQCALCLGELASSSAEMPLSYSINTIDAIAHLNAVEIDFHDALFAPYQFDKYGEIDLEALTYPRATRPQEHVLGRLLRYGRCAVLTLVGMLNIAHGSLFDGFEVKAMMLLEVSILRGHYGSGHRRVHLFYGHPMVVERQLLMIGFLLCQADKHKRCEIDGHPPQDNNRKNSGGEERHHYPFNGFLEFLNESQFLLHFSLFTIRYSST